MYLSLVFPSIHTGCLKPPCPRPQHSHYLSELVFKFKNNELLSFFSSIHIGCHKPTRPHPQHSLSYQLSELVLKFKIKYSLNLVFFLQFPCFGVVRPRVSQFQWSSHQETVHTSQSNLNNSLFKCSHWSLLYCPRRPQNFLFKPDTCGVQSKFNRYLYSPRKLTQNLESQNTSSNFNSALLSIRFIQTAPGFPQLRRPTLCI